MRIADRVKIDYSATDMVAEPAQTSGLCWLRLPEEETVGDTTKEANYEDKFGTDYNGGICQPGRADYNDDMDRPGSADYYDEDDDYEQGTQGSTSSTQLGSRTLGLQQPQTQETTTQEQRLPEPPGLQRPWCRNWDYRKSQYYRAWDHPRPRNARERNYRERVQNYWTWDNHRTQNSTDWDNRRTQHYQDRANLITLNYRQGQTGTRNRAQDYYGRQTERTQRTSTTGHRYRPAGTTPYLWTTWEHYDQRRYWNIWHYPDDSYSCNRYQPTTSYGQSASLTTATTSKVSFADNYF